MMAKRRRGYIRYDIDVSELIDEIDDNDLLEEVKDRKLFGGLTSDGDPLEMVREAYRELLCGRVHEARAILDRLLNPKWDTVDACQRQYEAAKLI